MTTDEQIQFWDENGYLKFGKVLEQGEVAELLAGLDRIVRIESEECDDSSIEFSIGHDRGGEGGAYGEAITQYLNLWKRDAAYDRTVRHPLITGIAKQLLKSPELRLWHDHVISKPPGENDRFQFHQDFYNWPLADPNILTCWIALDDATVANGCMHVVPGSHRDPRFLPAARKKELEELAQNPDARTERVIMGEHDAGFGVPVELKSGECMFHHSLNFHSTPKNTTDSHRRAFVIIYLPAGMCVTNTQAWDHPLVPLFEVAPGEPVIGSHFPVVG
ncbi:MAG: phytanoyl-CoA dioxygenase family protein [Lentisphaeria bacterium]|jgi:ectoine hydroxylase-related dioxygenase (phytanoyl-CoA dioxygenase family)|nr:phytanoyl-CoA dioxygenase family protein [Lentisphaeria bacterium]